MLYVLHFCYYAYGDDTHTRVTNYKPVESGMVVTYA